MEEVVVTAQKRSQRLEDVPIAITSLSPEQLEQSGITNITQLGQVTPGVLIGRSGAQSVPVIRGISSAQSGPGADNPVATYVDGFYQPSKTANVFDFNNVKSIDVLKGPQGTLFGRNATGGAILVQTLDPSLSPKRDVTVSYGRFNDGRVNAYLSGGLSDTVATDLSLYYRKSDGYLHDFMTGKSTAPVEQFNVRSKTTLQASDKLKFTLTLEHGYISDVTTLIYPVTNGTGSVLYPGLAHATQPYTTSASVQPHYQINSNAIYLKGVADVGLGTLTSYTGYRDQMDLWRGDLGGYPLNIAGGHFENPEKVFTQEFNLNSKEGGRLTWVAGLFYLHDYSAYQNFEVNAKSAAFTVHQALGSTVKTDAWAAFFDGTYKLTDPLSMTLGARYGSEKRAYNFASTTNFIPPVVPASVASAVADKTWPSFTPRAVLTYKLADRTNVYGSISQGFRSGSFNGTAPSTKPVDPEKVAAYEMGFKTAGRGMRFDTSIFKYDYTNLQVSRLNFDTGVGAILVNAAKAEIYGADAQLSGNLGERFNYNLGAAYTHARYVSFPGAQDNTITGAGIPATVFVDASGNHLPRTPELTFNAGGEYRHPVSVGILSLSGNASYRSKEYFSPNDRLQLGGYTLVNARLGLSNPAETWKYSLYANNIFNKTYLYQTVSASYGDSRLYGEPRTIGVMANFKF